MTVARRGFVFGCTALLMQSPRPVSAAQRTIFDAHCHIIEPGFPIIENQGYKPPYFSLTDYLDKAKPLGVNGGAVVSGSFQGVDQTYLVAVLQRLGAGWVGVTQVANDVPDTEIVRLNNAGVRGLRFNMFRNSIADVDDVIALARRAHAIAGWHAEIYADAATLKPHVAALGKLPQIAIDHLGMSTEGVPILLDLVRAGAKVKATGFGRVTMDVPATLSAIATVSDSALIFGTDMPSTRARRAFQADDIDLVEQVLGPVLARRAFWENSRALYRLPAV